MKIESFSEKHLAAAEALALSCYAEERAICPILPECEKTPSLSRFAENGLGAAATENGELLGFLCCIGPIPKMFRTAMDGVFSPLHAHGAVRENRTDIYQRLYAAAAEKWVRAGALYHALALYEHDADGKRAFFEYGFGQRCADAVRPMTAVAHPPVTGFMFTDASAAEIRELRLGLDRHMWNSPFFRVSDDETRTAWLSRLENDAERRTFAARTADGTPVAYLDVADEGENFASDSEGMKNICGAYCLPAYRGTGLMNTLLDAVVSVLRAEGVTRLGVDYESMNPTALRYWRKHFTPYTASLTRRIDE